MAMSNLTHTQQLLLLANYEQAVDEIEAEQARRRLEQQEITAEEEGVTGRTVDKKARAGGGEP